MKSINLEFHNVSKERQVIQFAKHDEMITFLSPQG